MLRAPVTAGLDLYFYYHHTNHYYYVRGMRPLFWFQRWFWLPARAVPFVGWLEEDRGRVRAVHCVAAGELMISNPHCKC